VRRSRLYRGLLLEEVYVVRRCLVCPVSSSFHTAYVSLWLRPHMSPEDEQADCSPLFTNVVEGSVIPKFVRRARNNT
jgi:hypothetical protein